MWLEVCVNFNGTHSASLRGMRPGGLAGAEINVQYENQNKMTIYLMFLHLEYVLWITAATNNGFNYMYLALDQWCGSSESKGMCLNVQIWFKGVLEEELLQWSYFVLWTGQWETPWCDLKPSDWLIKELQESVRVKRHNVLTWNHILKTLLWVPSSQRRNTEVAS